MDKYEKVKKIGEGSFGKAILVKSKEDGHQFVIKEISIAGMSSKEREESTKEVTVLANMSHPNIVQYKESFEEGGCLYIVMDYCEGGDLFKKINSQAGILFREEQILDWFVQICLALKHVHDRKILHRDIKSQNIFLTKDGTVQLGDFGIARVLNSTVEFARTCIGTPYYLSPEICENKPYNNKSDIWALGCVLYEMCTLKHAFEAGNMKNLVLKIIRGSYPSVSVRYSQELHSLLGEVFKRNPRERPSVNAILAKPFLSCRIKNFLPPQIFAQEFRHTFFHKQPKVGVAPVPSAQKITKPACKYGVPLTVKKVLDGAKKPAERKPPVAHKAEGSRKKKMEMIEKERKRREQIFLLKPEQMKRYTKEKITGNRINQAREQGWKHVLSSSGGSSPEKKCFVGGRKSSGGVGSPYRSTVQAPIPASVFSKRPYEHYHSALDQMAKAQPKDISREGPSPGSRNTSRGVPAAAGPVMPNSHTQGLDHSAVRMEMQRHVSKQVHVSRHRSQMGAERAGQVEEFLQRKREAMLNKVRAEGQLGTRHNLAAIYGSRAGVGRCRRPKVNREEEEYLARLRQIRLQNFNERQQIIARLRGEKYDSDGSDSQGSSEETELRRKKLEAFKAQANTRAAVLKEQLEKKRKEASEREKRAFEDHLAARGLKVAACSAVASVAASSTSESPPPQPRPSQPDPAARALDLPASNLSTPAISLTVALKNVGAITPLKENPSKPELATEIQSEKKMILRRLNQNLKGPSTMEEAEDRPLATAEPGPAPQQDQPDAEKRPPSNGERKKWDVAELPVLPAAQQTLEETCTTDTTSVSTENRPSCGGDRKKWEVGVPLDLSAAQQTLEDTSIMTIDQTAGKVIQVGELQGEAQRRLWEVKKDAQVVKVLQEAELQPPTHQLQTTFTVEDTFSHPDKSHQPTATDHLKMSGEVLPPAADPVPAAEHEAPHQTVCGAAAARTATVPPKLPETPDQADVESLLLEECPKQTSRSPTGVQQAWEQEAHKEMPPGGIKRPTGTKEPAPNAEKSTESSGSTQHEEPLFMKLCSPAHRRTAALAILSAQSSMDESSSSLASRSRSVSPLHSKHQNALLIGLSTGMFDANNPKMLRTCSLPDLSRPLGVRQEAAVTSDTNTAPDNNLEIEDLEEAAKDDNQSETEDAYEDEDLRDIRASMERLLQEEGDMMKSPLGLAAGDFNGNPPENTHQELFDNIAAEIDPDNNRMVVDEDEEEDDDDDDDDEDDEEEEEEDEYECSNGSPGDEEVLTNGVEEEHHSNNGHLNEEWHSDNSGEDEGREAQHHDSIFSRLEELRFNLEQQMGFEKSIEAYNKIKAIHEDEDENIDLGSSLVLSILGTEHQHLYPNILHLVMADGAYQEDNDE